MADEKSPKQAKANKPSERSPKSKRNGKSRSPRTRKRKRRFEPTTEKLPTPPPDPRHELQQQQQQEKTSGERSPKRKSLENHEEAEEEDKENAFQQLDRLHSLMEQTLELRARNARLFRRVRELERFKALKRLEASTKRTFLQGELEPLAPEEDVGFAESLLSAMLESSAASSSSNQSAPAAAAQQVVARAKSFRAPMARQRSRSIGTEAQLPCNSAAAKRASCHVQYGAKRNSLVGTLGLATIPPKVSKWTKVKAAFKWEKAGNGTGAGTSLGNLVVEALEQDAARFLKIPDAQDNCTATSNTTPSGSSPRTAEHSGPPSPTTLSSSSSIDEIYTGIQKRIHAARPTSRETEEDPTRRSRSLDGEIIIPQNIQHSRDSVVRRLDKGHKSAWGMVKDIIQSRRESVRRPAPRTSLRSEDGYSLSSHESSDMLHEIATSDQSANSQVQVTVSESSLTVPSSKPSSPGNNSEIVDLASRRLTPTLTITVPSSEELRVSSPESTSPPTSHHQLDSTDERSPSEEPPDSASSPKPTTPQTTTLLGERRRSAVVQPSDKQPPPPPRLLQRQDSKWNKVKRAFLTSASSVPPSPSRTSSFFDETDGGGSYSASAEDLDNNGGVSPSIHSDIQRNYQILHDKLSVEFNRKLAEWEKMKTSQSSGSTSRASATSPKEKDSANALLMGEEQLTPEFKKKLQEWKRIKKTGNPSGTTSPENQLFRRRLTDWNIWRTPAKSESKTPESEPGKQHLSEDFLKKMEEWKKIKSTRSDEEQSITGRRDSAELIHQARKISQRWKTLDEKEFQPLDRVIAMIEREQKMVEKQRDRLIDKKLKLNDLSRILDSTHAKREVLVHTSTGFYKFEGISQEFTKKLYEWEKSQGIKPESSTLKLLHPAYKISVDKSVEPNHDAYARSFKRSKSMSSVVESSQRDETPIRQPSSLSLNDATNLENGAKLRIDSKQTIADEEMSEELVLDDSEPEAVIVDIEDVIEETASPMAKFQPQQTPVYCVTASETTSIAIPLGTVTASHEPSPVILVQAGETHHRVRKHCRFSQSYDEHDESRNSLESHSEAGSRTNSSDSNDENRRRIFDANDINICETIIEEEVTSLHIGEESSQDPERLSATQTTHNELIEPLQSTTKTINPIMNVVQNISRDEKTNGPTMKVENGSLTDESTSVASPSLDSERKLFKTFINSRNAKENDANGMEKCITTNDVIPNCNSRDVPHDIENDDVVITVRSDIRPKKVLKTRRLTDTQVGYKWRQSSQQNEEKSPEPADELTVSTFPETPSVERIIINESTLNKIVVPTNSNEQLANIVPSNDTCSNNSQSANDASEEEPYCRRITSKSESKSVFVKTKRMIFSPFSRRNAKDKAAAAAASPQKQEIPAVEAAAEAKKTEERPTDSQQPAAVSTPSVSQKILNIQRSRSSSECPIASERRPPLPQSPVLARKDYRRSSPKETAPSIRIMIQRYNQKLQEESAGSPASSGSGSPIWRSPTSERRVRNQMERYQEEVRRAISGSPRCDPDSKRLLLEKSASAGLIQPSSSALAQPRTGAANLRNEILKSTSADFVRNPPADDEKSVAENEAAAAAAAAAASGRRRSSLQNKNPEIFSNIRQCLAHESKTLPMRGDGIGSESQSRKSSMTSGENVSETIANRAQLSVEPAKRISGKISPDLIHKLNALTSAATQKLGRFYEENLMQSSASSTPLGMRAQRVQQAKDDFMSRGPSCHSHDPSIDDSSGGSRCSVQEFVKSASAGMINVDSRAYERLQREASESRGGTLSKIASKFRRAKLRRAKDRDCRDKLSTVSMLCRQSLLVDIQNGEMSSSCPTSPRDDDEHHHRHHSRFKQHRESN